MNCPSCQADQPDTNRFCGQCGAALASVAGEVAPARRAGERRQMTILFYDLVDSTALAARSDPEDFSEALERFHHQVGLAMKSLGGFVGARVGDGAVVYFGYPHAQEDAAERAVLAALRALEVCAEVALPGGEMARMRVGVATGQGIINPAEDDAGGNEVVGSAANLAARLQAAAQPGAVVISDATRRLLGGAFEMEDLGGVQAKGFSAPVQAWRVTARSRHERFDAVDAARETPMVGRIREMERLETALADARAGQGRMVLVSGEPGLGKSRLAGEFAQQAERDGVLRINLHGSTHATEAPLRPFIRHLQRLGGIDEHAGGVFSGLRGLAPDTDPDDAALLSKLLGLPALESPELQALTSARRLDRTIDALLRQLELFSRGHVVLVLFEDAHWADPTSLSVLERAARAGRFERVLIVVTARPEFRPAWIGEAHVREIALAPMAPEDGAALIYRIAGAQGLTPSLRRAILDRADGVPLFLEELTRSTLEVAADSGGDLNAEYDLPMTLQDSLLARLDRLGTAKEIAQVAAVIGRRFPRHLVEALSDLGPQEKIRALQRLLESGLIEADRQGESQAYRFRHVLVQQTAYGALLRAERRRLNARLLKVIETEHASIVSTEPERLAHYAAEAGQPREAAQYWLAAGLQALAQTAMPEASSRLRRGLAMVAQLPQDAARWHIELQLELALGKALIATIGYALPETGAAFARAKMLCEAIGEKSELLAVLHGLWIHDLMCGRLRSARTRADDLLKLAESEQDDAWTLIGCRARGVLGYPLGEFELSRATLERGLALFNPSRRPDYAVVLVDDPRVVMLMYLAWVLTFLGREAEARATIAACLVEARNLGQPYSLAHALAGRVLTGLFMEEYDGVGEVIDELAALTAEHEIAYYAAVSKVLRGRYLARTGRGDEGARALETALDAYRATGSILYLPTFMMWCADAVGRAGRLDEALALIAQARTLIEQTGMDNDAAEIHRVEGELLHLSGAPAAARTAIEAALKIARRQGAHLYVRRAEASLEALKQPASAPS